MEIHNVFKQNTHFKTQTPRRRLRLLEEEVSISWAKAASRSGSARRVWGRRSGSWTARCFVQQGRLLQKIFAVKFANKAEVRSEELGTSLIYRIHPFVLVRNCLRFGLLRTSEILCYLIGWACRRCRFKNFQFVYQIRSGAARHTGYPNPPCCVFF